MRVGIANAMCHFLFLYKRRRRRRRRREMMHAGIVNHWQGYR